MLQCKYFLIVCFLIQHKKILHSQQARQDRETSSIYFFHLHLIELVCCLLSRLTFTILLTGFACSIPSHVAGSRLKPDIYALYWRIKSQEIIVHAAAQLLSQLGAEVGLPLPEGITRMHDEMITINQNQPPSNAHQLYPIFMLGHWDGYYFNCFTPS